jgi:hypothetical protein
MPKAYVLTAHGGPQVESFADLPALDRAPEGLRLVEEGHARGKIAALVRRPHGNQASPIAPFGISVTRGRGERRFLPGPKSGVSTPQL